MPQITKKCIYCGKKFTRPKWKAKYQKYCSQECHYADHRATLICKECGKTFTVMKNQADGRQFCSPECRITALTIPSKRAICVCKWCGKKFEGWTYRKRRFCSRICAAKYAGAIIFKSDIHVIVECECCSKIFETQIRPSRNPQKYCSKKCMGIMRMGATNPNWKGGPVSNYGSNWSRQSRLAKSRDKYICQICGYKAGDDLPLDVHHIISLRKFKGNWRTANKLSNLISLCRICHVKVETGKMTLLG